jgi:ethanolamine ammonia-lyase large subunit
MHLSCTAGGQRFLFDSIKEVLAKANEEKSGDRLAGIAAETEIERVAAKQVLSELTLEELRGSPAVGDADEVTRLVDAAIDEASYQRISNWSVAELREYLLSHTTTNDDIAALRWALNGEMAAAVTKLMSNMDLVRAARKCPVVSRANNTLGLTGRLGARLQPNHPADSIDGFL